MRVIFFKKYLKLNVNFRNPSKNSEKSFLLWDNCTWIGSCKFSLLQRKCMSSAVNLLINSPKISPITNRHIFGLNVHLSDEKIWWKGCRQDSSNVLDPLTCWLSKGVLKGGLFGHLSSHVFRTPEFPKYIGYDGHGFFFKILKNHCRFQKRSEKLRQSYLFFRSLHLNWLR